MRFDPIRVALIMDYLDKHVNSTMGKVFADLVTQGYSMAEIRYSFNLWIAAKYDE
jgi:hypothetical protein